MSSKKIPSIHPGEILKEEFLDAFDISQYRLAKDINDSVDLVPKTLPKVFGVTKYSVYKKYLPPYIDISVL